MPELIPAEPGTPEWLAARRQGVTATDIVTILGLSSWSSAYALYWQKLGQVPETSDNDRFRLGRELEPYVVQRWCEAADWASLAGPGLYQHSARPWQMATVDMLVYNGEPLEVKTWADADRHSWDDQPPATVRAQVLWQMDVMDVATGHVGVVFLPSGEFRSYVIEHNTSCVPGVRQGCANCEDQALMRERGAEFYARLRGELPPPPIGVSEASLAAVKARFGSVVPQKTAEVDPGLWDAYRSAADAVAASKELQRAFENQIREQLAEATLLQIDGRTIAQRRVYDSPVKAHTRHVDGIWRVKGGDDD